MNLIFTLDEVTIIFDKLSQISIAFDYRTEQPKLERIKGYQSRDKSCNFQEQDSPIIHERWVLRRKTHNLVTFL